MEIPIKMTVVDENEAPKNLVMIEPPMRRTSLDLRSNTKTKKPIHPPTPIDSPKGPISQSPRVSEENSNIIECPFHTHGCHKKGEINEVKRHVRDDRNLHLFLLCQSLNPIRNNAIRQQNAYIEKYVGMLTSMTVAETVYEKYGCQHTIRIPNFGITVVKASKNKSHRTIFGQPFYTHGYGYKMMAMVMPYGDGEALREFVSVFVCLVKGEYDDILDWPLKCKTTFSVLTNDKKNIISRTFDPTNHPEIQNFFERPTGQRNGSFGFQDLVQIGNTENITLSGDFFVQIKVLLKPELLSRAKEIDSSKCQGSSIEMKSKTE